VSRTTRYKLQYAVALSLGVAASVMVVVTLRERPTVLIGLGALALVPGRLSGFVWRDLYRGRRLLERGQVEASIEAFGRFLALLAERPRLRRLWWLAFAVYTRDAKAMALNNAGAAHLEFGRFDDAELHFREAIATDPEYPIPHFNLAVLFAVHGEDSEAQEHARRAVELGYTRDAADRAIGVATALLARVEGRGPGLRQRAG
jgi:tetratricopeptide (TPR) repeat protein